MKRQRFKALVGAGGLIRNAMYTVNDSIDVVNYETRKRVNRCTIDSRVIDMFRIKLQVVATIRGTR